MESEYSDGAERAMNVSELGHGRVGPVGEGELSVEKPVREATS